MLMENMLCYRATAYISTAGRSSNWGSSPSTPAFIATTTVLHTSKIKFLTYNNLVNNLTMIERQVPNEFICSPPIKHLRRCTNEQKRFHSLIK